MFQVGKNCWRTGRADHVALLIDCADYFRAIHEAICRAKRSIFILGWDIDTGTHLLRGAEEREASAPSVLIDLLAEKARRRPELQVYLLRWDSSLSFMTGHEFVGEFALSAKIPENVHIWMDDTSPMGGSHHQKIVVIDDEVAFSGGMDVTRQRWDESQHRIEDPRRNDASGPYTPYHDVQVMFDGPIVSSLAQWVRKRWLHAARYEAIPIRKVSYPWPGGYPPQVSDIDCAIARTIPRTDTLEGAQETRQMYLDLIRSAEEFIYIENQFLTSEGIASALNHQLRRRSKLRALIASSYEPKGLIEREGMWAGRIRFKEVSHEGIDPDRVKIVCSSAFDDQGRMVPKRIHSKVMIVDESYMDVASSNLTNRSMVLDSELDVVFAARTREHAAWIASARNRLIAEHSGFSPAQVGRLIEENRSLGEFFRQEAGGYRLREVDDSSFTHPRISAITRKIVDPSEVGRTQALRNPPRRILLSFSLIALALLATIILVKTNTDLLSTERIREFLLAARESRFALPLTCAIYTAAGFLFFPVTLLSLLTAAVFGVFLGPLYGLCGALASAAVMFALGRLLGIKGLRGFFGSRVRMIDRHLQRAGVAGVALVRLIPIAPYSLVNLVAGISSVRFVDYMVGTILGFLPGFLAKGIVADSLMRMLLDPTQKSGVFLALGILLWVALATTTYWGLRKWRRRRIPSH